MSSHTIVYKKKVFLTKDLQEKVIQASLDAYKRIPPYNEWSVSELTKDYEMLFKWDETKKLQYYDELVESEQRWLSKLNNCKSLNSYDEYELYILNWKPIGYDKNNNRSFYIYKDWFYEEIAYDIPFRIYGYYAETFFHVDDLIGWLKTLPNEDIGHMELQDNHYNIVYGLSESLEKEIRDFVEKNGADNLYWECGF